MVQVLGSQKGDSAKTPTLRQYYAQHGSAPKLSYVKIVFKPNKSPAFGLVTDHGFRVNVYEDSPLHGVLTTELDDWELHNVCLYVQVDNAEKGYWTLCIDETKQTTWEPLSWGLRAMEDCLAKPRPKSKTKSPE